MRAFLLGYLVCIVLACRPGAGSPAPVSLGPLESPVDSARCAGIRDSVSGLDWLQLPISEPKRAFRLPVRPSDAAATLQTQFIVMPNGVVDTATVVITGTGDERYRRDMIRRLRRNDSSHK